MAMQLLVGVPLEMVHGALRIGLVYTCGVLAGGCLVTHMFAHILSLSLFHLLVVHFSYTQPHISLQPPCW